MPASMGQLEEAIGLGQAIGVAIASIFGESPAEKREREAREAQAAAEQARRTEALERYYQALEAWQAAKYEASQARKQQQLELQASALRASSIERYVLIASGLALAGLGIYYLVK